MYLSRRRLLGSFAVGAGAVLLAACGQSSSPAATSAPAKPAETKPAESKPTEAAKPAAPAAAAQPTSAPAAAAKPAEAAKPAAGGPVVVWLPADMLPEVTSLINDKFTAVAKEKGFQFTFEELPGTAAGTDRFTAAVQAGTPPDVYRNFDYQNQFWRIQNQLVDVSDIVNPVKDKQGGFLQPV